MATDISIKQGALFEMVATIKDPLGARVDLTGQTFRGKIKSKFADTTSLATFQFELADQADPDTKGDVRFFILPADTTAMALPANRTGDRTIIKAPYDIEWVQSAERVYRILEGNALISPEVTK